MRGPRATVLVVVALAATLAACGSTSAPSTGQRPSPASRHLIAPIPGAGSAPGVTIGAKNFTEQFVLGEIYAQALEASGFRIRRQFDLGSEQIAFAALRAHRIDAYPEYTGTILTSFCGVKIAAVPRSSGGAFAAARRCLAPKGVAALAPTPFSDSEALAVTAATARRRHVATLSQLAAVAKGLTFASAPECAQRPDCLLGLERVYGIRFRRFVSIDIGKRYDVLVHHQADVTSAFTTDGQIKADNLVLLHDDRRLFPPYNATLLTRDHAFGALGTAAAGLVARVQAGLTTPVMRELNARVDLDKQRPAAVAREYLHEAGYLG